MNKYPLARKGLAVGIILLFVGTTNIPSTAQKIDEKESPLLCRGGEHVPIHIYGNDEFTPENGVTGGNGTVNNPYLIENWVFIMVGSEQAISIWSTNAYFIIRNCTIRGFPNGIWFSLVANGMIEETTIDVSENGIIMDDTQNIMIIDNKIICDLINLGLESANNILISRNIFIVTWIVIGGSNNNYTFSYNTLINSSLHVWGNCNICCNNFINNEYFYRLFLIEIHMPLYSHIRLKNNYWWRPTLFPKFILGTLYKPGGDHPEFELPWFFIDWRPALKPYDISRLM